MTDRPCSLTRPARRRLAACLFAALAPLACTDGAPPLPVTAEIGEPLPGLSAEEVARFEAGRAVFTRPFTQEEGLGPRFNENACNACHTFPADGGTGETGVNKATRLANDGSCDPLIPQGGENLRIQVTDATRTLGGESRRSIPEATHTARFTIPFLFGLGLVEAIPLRTLMALSDPDDANGDGISGRLGVDAAGRPSRFGRKADVATLADFADGAFRLEMGMTTAATPDEDRAGSVPPVPDGSDLAPEPEIGAAELRDVVDFMRFLAPPAAADRRDDPQVIAGQALFTSLGCMRCHVPVLTAGPDTSSAIANQSIALYSDLLLHDMGPALTGTCTAGAGPEEYRTEPLMGLRYREIFLHDGRVSRVIDAILLHGGEAEAARDAFAALDRVTQEALLQYLRTL